MEEREKIAPLASSFSHSGWARVVPVMGLQARPQ